MTTAASLPIPSIRFGVFELDTASGELRKAGVSVHLRPQASKVLAALAKRPGDLVTRDELRQAIWGPDHFVDFDHGLNLCILQIREALGDDAASPRYIQTLSGRGYRFIAPVSPASPPAVRAGLGPVRRGPLRRQYLALAAGVLILAVITLIALNVGGLRGRLLQQGAAVPKIESIAVLPMENLSRDPDQEYFADGITEELITDLGKIGSFRVISRTSVMHYKGTRKTLPEIARELNVDAIVEGTVQRSGNRVRITANLLYAPTDRHLWANSYESEMQDILVLRGEVAEAIAEEVRGKLTPDEHARLARARTVNPEAYELYLKGRYEWNKRTKEGLNKGLEYFQQANRIEPEYALAYVGLSDSYAVLAQWNFLPPHNAYPKAREAAIKALQIDASLAEAHTSLAAVKHYFDWDWAGAEMEYKRAIELNPNYASAHQWYGEFLGEMSRHEEAVAQAGIAQRLDPFSSIIRCTLGEVFCFAREYDQALQHHHSVQVNDPSFIGVHHFLARTYEAMGQYQEAASEFQKAIILTGGSEGLFAQLGHVYGVSGKRREAWQIVDKLKDMSGREYVSPLHMALVYTGLGEKDRALVWLEKAYEDRSNFMSRLKVDRRFDPLRSDPRFQDLVRRMNFPK